MAHVDKYTHTAAVNLIRHMERTIANPANKDIDRTRSHRNYKLSPERKCFEKSGTKLFAKGQSDYDYYKSRKSQVYCYGRSDLKTIAGWVIPMPRDLPPEQHKAFFQETYNFLERRYRAENVVNACVHLDESGVTGHLHFLFMPIAPDKKHGGEKICANAVLTRRELRVFHTELAKHLKSAGINANILNGATAGGNRSVSELKHDREIERISELEREIARLKEILREPEREKKGVF